MATQVQFRRGTTTENNAFTGAVAELTVDTTLTTLRVHDGTSAGGIAVINANSAQVITNKTYGNGNTWEGTPPTLTYGGTGKALTAVQGGIVYSDSNSMEISLAGTAGQVLTSGGTAAPIWVTPSSLTVGTASVATTAQNITGGSAGYLVYQFDTDDTSFIEPGASGTFLQSTGASTAPTWATGDVTYGSTTVALGGTATTIDGLDQLNATGTSHWTLPAGTTAQRPGTPAAGMVRYNSTISSFEGYGPGGAWGSLGGVKDVDQDTYLLTEASAGSDEDTFEFFNAGTNTAALDTTALELKNDVYMQFDTGSAAHPSHSEGALFYSAEYKAPTYYNDIAGVSNQIGLEEWIRVKNVTGSTITNGTPVYATGASGEVPTVAPSDATTEMKARVIGVATHDIANNAEGVATVRGLVSGIDTSALTAGQPVHVGADGSLQTAAPTAPFFPTDVGGCIVSDATEGYIYVRIQEHTMEQLRVTGNTKMDGNLTVAGDLTVSGTQTITSQANLALDNSFIYMNSGDTIGEANTSFSGSGLDDAYFTGHFEGTASTTYYVRIDGVGTGTGGVDTFEWSKDNFSTTEATGVDLSSTTDVALDNNIKIHFNAATGHTSGDTWSGTAAPLNVDTGWASNRNTGASGVGYTHIGCMYDVASNQFIMFDEYDPEIEGNIDTADASFQYGNLQIAGLTATTGAFSGNGTIGGTLVVTGGTTLSSTLGVTGAATLSSTLDVTGAITGAALNVSTGAITAGSLDISGDADIDGTMEADAYTVNGTALDEYISDTAGAMWSSNTESNITVTYDDADNTLDISLNDTAVTPGSYGSSTAIPTFTVDQQGRLTAAGTTAISSDMSIAGDSGTDTITVGTDTFTIAGGTGVTTTASTDQISIAIGQAVGTGDSVTFSSVTAGSFTETSDVRLKTDIKQLTNAVDTVKALDGKSFVKDNKAKIGLIAQEVEEVLPQVVDTLDDEMQTKTVNYGNIVAVLIEAIKEQQVQIDELKKKLGE